MKVISLGDAIIKEFGIKGTPERDKFDSEIKQEILKKIEREKRSSNLILNKETKESRDPFCLGRDDHYCIHLDVNNRCIYPYFCKLQQKN